MNFQATVDLTNCDREPIHLLGAIQPIGFLLALTADWMVARASANWPTSRSRRDGPDRPAARRDLLRSEAIHDLRNRVACSADADAVGAISACLVRESLPFDVALHFSAGQIVIEASPPPRSRRRPGMVRAMIARLDQARDMTAFFNEGARQVRALLGFRPGDGLHFAADGSGEVVAEACGRASAGSRGCTIPPATSRRRPASSTSATCCVILTSTRRRCRSCPRSTSAASRSTCRCRCCGRCRRSTSNICKNMGVAGVACRSRSSSTGKLWGLFACHHYAPRCPSFERRSVSELFAQMFSMRLESRERQETVEFERRARDISDQLLGAVASDETLLKRSRLAGATS